MNHVQNQATGLYEGMDEWHRILRKVVCHGVERPDRTGVGTLACFGEQLVFDNRTTFPAVTTKRLAFKPMAAELACFLRGYDRLSQFNDMGCHIWDGNGREARWVELCKEQSWPEGYLGRIYGVQWRNWKRFIQYPNGEVYTNGTTDQLGELVQGIRRDPYGRRHLVTAWNPGELGEMCLPPCHVLFQAFLYPTKEGHPHALDLRVDMRSVDLFLGLPFDVASYALLQRLLCRDVGASSGWLVFHLGDAHIYRNHLEQVDTVLAREPKQAPTLELAPEAGLFEFEPDMAQLLDYHPHPAVPAPLNV